MAPTTGKRRPSAPGNRTGSTVSVSLSVIAIWQNVSGFSLSWRWTGPQIAEEQGELSIGAPCMPEKVLIVEPDPDSAEELFLLFHRGDLGHEPGCYEPVVAVCMTEALDKMATERFQCVIVDAALQEMQIDKAITLMRAIRRDIPIIVVAGENNLEMEARIRQLNIQYYHIKSHDPEDLKLAVRSMDGATQRPEGIARGSGACGPLLLRPLKASHNSWRSRPREYAATRSEG